MMLNEEQHSNGDNPGSCLISNAFRMVQGMVMHTIMARNDGRQEWDHLNDGVIQDVSIAGTNG